METCVLNLALDLNISKTNSKPNVDNESDRFLGDGCSMLPGDGNYHETTIMEFVVLRTEYKKSEATSSNFYLIKNVAKHSPSRHQRKKVRL